MTQQRPPGSLAEAAFNYGEHLQYRCVHQVCIDSSELVVVGRPRPISNSQPDEEEIMKKRELERMETRMKELRATLKSLAEGKDFDRLSLIIRKPGWTTVAEVAFLNGLLDSMHGQAKNIATLKQAILSGAQKVELNPQPLPPEPPPRD